MDYHEGFVSVMLQRKEDAMKTLELIEGSGMTWDDLSMQHESLDDVFVRLVGRPVESETAAGAN